MTQELNWKFRKGDRGYDGGNAADLPFPPSIEAVLREGLQNAVDAKLKEKEFVEVDVELIYLSGEKKDAYLKSIKWNDLKKHIKGSVEEVQSDTSERGRKLASGLSNINKKNEDLLLLKISDYNTTGLFGYEDSNEEGNLNNTPNPFEGLMRSHLGSQKNNVDSGGSFGMGKASYIGVSGINTYFCNSVINTSEIRMVNKDALKLTEFTKGKYKNRILGRTDITSHKVDGVPRKREGFFGSVNNPEDLFEEVDSFFDEQNQYVEELYLDRRKGSGTTVLIPALFTSGNINEKDTRSPEDMFKEIQNLVVKNFWPAIIKGTLKINVIVQQSNKIYASDRIDPADDAFLPNLSKLLQNNLEQLKNPHANFKNIVTKEDIEHINLSEQIIKNEKLEISVNFEIPSTRKLDKKDAANKHGVKDHDTGLLIMKVTDVNGLSELEQSLLNSIATFRHPGMVVEYMNKFSTDEDDYFLGLLVCGTYLQNDDDAKIADRFLKYLEPPHHDKWDPRDPQVNKWKMFYRENTFRSTEKTALRAFDEFMDLVKNCIESTFQEKVEISEDLPDTIKKLGNINFGGDDEGGPTVPKKGISRSEDSYFNSEKTILTREISIDFPEKVGNKCTLDVYETIENVNGTSGDPLGYKFVNKSFKNAKINKNNSLMLDITLTKKDRTAEFAYEVNFPDQNIDSKTVSTQSEIFLGEKNV